MPTHDFIPPKWPPSPSGRFARVVDGHPLRMIEQVEDKLAVLAGKLGSKAGQRQHRALEAEIANLTQFKAHLYRMTRRRKPPEAGLAVPAVPPRGPLPLQGGAEAPLEFGD